MKIQILGPVIANGQETGLFDYQYITDTENPISSIFQGTLESIENKSRAMEERSNDRFEPTDEMISDALTECSELLDENFIDCLKIREEKGGHVKRIVINSLHVKEANELIVDAGMPLTAYEKDGIGFIIAEW